MTASRDRPEPACPPYRFGVFGGVYGNPRALEAVLADARARGVDELWCLGDLGGFGPDPEAAIEILRAAAVPSIRGNYDQAIGTGASDCGCGYADARDRRWAQVAYDFTRARTSERHRAWLRGLPSEVRLERGGRHLLLCHGSPRRVNEFLWESISPDPFLERLCADHGADVLVCSHTGLHWERALPSGAHVVNAGVIGRPPNDGDPRAAWAEVTMGATVEVRFHRTAYDSEGVAREVESAGLPVQFATTLRTGWWTTCLGNLPAPERRRGRH